MHQCSKREEPAARPSPCDGHIQPRAEIRGVWRGPIVQCLQEIRRRDGSSHIVIEDVQMVVAPCVMPRVTVASGAIVSQMPL